MTAINPPTAPYQRPNYCAVVVQSCGRAVCFYWDRPRNVVLFCVNVVSLLSVDILPQNRRSWNMTYFFGKRHSSACLSYGRDYDHKFYDHGCVPIGRRDQWGHSATFGYDHGTLIHLKHGWISSGRTKYLFDFTADLTGTGNRSGVVISWLCF